jgi:two-component system chemotaxis response regulator CheY
MGLAPKVLIVDDTSFQRDRLRSFFESRGFETVWEADDGRQAVTMFDLYRPDLVTMDINMPYMNGIDALVEIKRRNPDARIIMISAMGDKGTIKEALDAGARDFVIKPFTFEILEKKVIENLSDLFPGFFKMD